MGNIAVMIATNNISDFNSDSVESLLKDNFKDITFIRDKNAIRAEYRDSLVTKLFFNMDSSYLINYLEDIKHLREMNMNDLANKLKELELFNPDLTDTLQLSYGTFMFFDKKLAIERFLRLYFKAYLFDEGIHPQFIEPDYKEIEKKSLFQKIINFLRK